MESSRNTMLKADQHVNGGTRLSGGSTDMPHSPRAEKSSRGTEKRSDRDFIFGKLIGEGSFSSVYLAKDIHTDQEYAVKVCDKEHINGNARWSTIIREKDVMNVLNDRWEASAPFFVKLSYAFQDVYLAKDIHTDQEYAVKVCDKEHIKRERKVEHIIREKDVMNVLNDRWEASAPFFVKLSYAFQDVNKLCILYFVMTFCKNGELLNLIQRVGNFNREGARFYTGELVRALEHLHSLRIIHRDLKPENILLDEGMHVKVTDFGCAKMLHQEDMEGADDRPRKKSSRDGPYVSPSSLISAVVLAFDMGAPAASYRWSRAYPPSGLMI
ncbi:putative 3-phosphoinositide-dependent protein kinase 2 [Chionoecetes opilio]|uniref:non-specific serine/threonine protein kinase n=1 Tax=Chionoecetes opilio TaxID=41210 RepID=A0A8J4YLK2_CHIOP|nr:putative 3-phosphoinositide-dependent protein kinase 2 [Chionoecetes opilio]